MAEGMYAWCLATEGVHVCERCQTSLPEEHFAVKTDAMCKTCIQEMFAFSLGNVERTARRQLPPIAPSEPIPLSEPKRGDRTLYGNKRVTEVGWSRERKLLEHMLRHKYGIGTDQYYQMLAAQHGKCAI